MQVCEKGSVRVDLVGGTLDLDPINLIIPNVVTLNVATSLMAEVQVRSTQEETMTIDSLDYNKSYCFPAEQMTNQNIYENNTFEEMSFVVQILDLFDIRSGVELTLKSGAPAGSGLGGSSAMGITLYKALCKYRNQNFDVQSAVQHVKSVEGRILNRGVPGYQDYFPAAVGGVLALKAAPKGLEIEQLYDKGLKSFLENHLTLVYSGISRNSGINNWDVYKGFFDQDPCIQKALRQIASVSYEAYLSIKRNEYSNLLELIGQEGELRKSLGEGIVPVQVHSWYENLKRNNIVCGMKMCGAGGGGCFILVHQAQKKAEISKKIKESEFEELALEIIGPFI